MTDPAIALPLITVVALAPALKLSAALLVPARVTWRSALIVSAVFALLAAPSIWQFSLGRIMPGYWWLMAAAGVHCLAAGWYMRNTTGGLNGQLGFRRGGELAILGIAIALTAGVAVWAKMEGVHGNAP